MAALEGQARAYKDEQSEQAARKAALQQRVAQQMEKLRHSAPHMARSAPPRGARVGPARRARQALSLIHI